MKNKTNLEMILKVIPFDDFIEETEAAAETSKTLIQYLQIHKLEFIHGPMGLILMHIGLGS